MAGVTSPFKLGLKELKTQRSLHGALCAGQFGVIGAVPSIHPISVIGSRDFSDSVRHGRHQAPSCDSEYPPHIAKPRLIINS
jgi:hypothetical protein